MKDQRRDAAVSKSAWFPRVRLGVSVVFSGSLAPALRGERDWVRGLLLGCDVDLNNVSAPNHSRLTDDVL